MSRVKAVWSVCHLEMHSGFLPSCPFWRISSLSANCRTRAGHSMSLASVGSFARSEISWDIAPSIGRLGALKDSSEEFDTRYIGLLQNTKPASKHAIRFGRRSQFTTTVTKSTLLVGFAEADRTKHDTRPGTSGHTDGGDNRKWDVGCFGGDLGNLCGERKGWMREGKSNQCRRVCPYLPPR